MNKHYPFFYCVRFFSFQFFLTYVYIFFRYFDAVPGTVSQLSFGDNDGNDLFPEIDTDEADIDEFLTFDANPR